jgi:hypothetical protein
VRITGRRGTSYPRSRRRRCLRHAAARPPVTAAAQPPATRLPRKILGIEQAPRSAPSSRSHVRITRRRSTPSVRSRRRRCLRHAAARPPVTAAAQPPATPATPATPKILGIEQAPRSAPSSRSHVRITRRRSTPSVRPRRRRCLRHAAARPPVTAAAQPPATRLPRLPRKYWGSSRRRAARRRRDLTCELPGAGVPRP